MMTVNSELRIGYGSANNTVTVSSGAVLSNNGFLVIGNGATDSNNSLVITNGGQVFSTGNNAAIGGLKVVTASGWFAARPSGTENIYKIYAESFKDAAHFNAIVKEAQEIVSNSLG